MDQREIIEIYDDVVTFFLEYKLMVDKISNIVFGRTLEIGVGTGLLTKRLLTNSKISELDLIEISGRFIKKFHEKFQSVHVKQSDGVSYRGENLFDTIAMSLVYHHIKDEDKLHFLNNMYRNLACKGRLIIGDLFIPHYNLETQRNIKLKKFHNFRLRKIDDPKIKEIEIQSLKDGLKRIGEWKTSYKFLKKQLNKIGFKEINCIPLGSQESGGYKVIVASK